ncbi:hypothetical protein FGG08_003751 [Glutinoglossum americanum]|uniref:Uncharacterized protein n=1 Tax=Glutinoglossum americanum TaxID=1670608 RepID=A0A9P8L3D0_9PEZI|nr:hypothetical protein FGG08_003751 [Glutinoglossum americanum]
MSKKVTRAGGATTGLLNNLMLMDDRSIATGSMAGSKRTANKEVDFKDIRSSVQRQKVSELAYWFKIEKLEDYDSRNQYKYKKYIQRCEIAFQIQFVLYKLDHYKIFYVSQFLRSETLDA